MSNTNNIRKPFAEIIALLEANQNKSVKSILDSVKELCESKKKDSTIRKDASGKITHIFCYYHKEWEPVEWYGSKQSSHSGFNTMCKIGVNEWTRRQSAMKKERDNVLTSVSEGLLLPANVQKELERIEKMNTVIIPRAKSLEILVKKNAPSAEEKKD